MCVPKPIDEQDIASNDEHGESINKGAKPSDNISNPLNLFDDSNRKEEEWLKIATAYLSGEK